ncbi:Trp biosynthesis-associated membrane protein [Angustibacter speluncae]
MSRFGKGPVVVALVVLAVVLLAASSRTWVSAQADLLTGGAVAGRQVVMASGSAVAPAAGALGLVVLAAAGLLLLARPVVRVVAGALVVLAGLAAAVVAAGVLLDPTAAVLPSVAEASGLTPGSVTADDVASVRLTGWPVVAVVAAVLAALVGVVVLAAGRRWGTARRFERDPAPTRGDDWDALSRGDDPTAGMMDP